MDQTLSDLRALLAATGIRQKTVATRLGMHKSRLSKILGGDIRMPADFEPRFRAALAEIAVEKATSELAVSRSRARVLLEAAGARLRGL